ncbi:MAG TPA: tetratricopeptide repeat protein [Micromonosporaceae bacterium]|jgi:tetratricopeptide (TPR) repeat protein
MSPFHATQPERSAGGRRSDAAAWHAFRSQSVPGQRLFGLLRSLPGSDHSTVGLSAAMALSDAETLVLLESLEETGLIRPSGPSRFQVTPVGAALRPEWSGAETRSLQRWYDWGLGTVTAAAELLYPQALRLDAEASTTVRIDAPTTAVAASAFLEAEGGNLLDAIGSARVLGLGRYAYQLADALRGWAWINPYAGDWVTAATAAVSAARAVGGPRESAAAYLCLADAHFLAGDLDLAEEACMALGANAARAGWLSGSASSHANRGGIHHRRGRHEEALREYLQALELFGATGRPASQATLCNNIGGVQLALGEVHQAVGFHRRALVLFRQLGSLAGEARTLEMLAQAWRACGQREAAARGILQAYMVYGRLGDRVGEARTRASAAALRLENDEDEEPAA